MTAQWYVRIDDSADVRRRLLESSKASIHILRGYQDLIRIRGEKLELLAALRRELKELTVLLNRAEALLPSFNEAELVRLRSPSAVPAPVVRGKKGKSVPPPQAAAPVRPRQDLVDKLREIERRLETL